MLDTLERLRLLHGKHLLGVLLVPRLHDTPKFASSKLINLDKIAFEPTRPLLATGNGHTTADGRAGEELRSGMGRAMRAWNVG